MKPVSHDGVPAQIRELMAVVMDWSARATAHGTSSAWHLEILSPTKDDGGYDDEEEK